MHSGLVSSVRAEKNHRLSFGLFSDFTGNIFDFLKTDHNSRIILLSYYCNNFLKWKAFKSPAGDKIKVSNSDFSTNLAEGFLAAKAFPLAGPVIPQTC